MTKRKRKQLGQPADSPLEHRDKKRKLYIYVAVVLVIVAAVVWRVAFVDDSPKPLTRLTQFKHHGDLAFVTSTGDTLKTIQIEVVDDMQMIQAGLMYRKELTDDQGMLFVMPREEIQTFWMKNTVISLDMIFATSTGVIQTIRHRTIPYSLESVNSTGPAKYVLEVRAGFAEEYGILETQLLLWTLLDSTGTASP